MNLFKKLYIFIFALIIASGSLIIYRSIPGPRQYEFRSSEPKPDVFSAEFYKNFDANNLERSLKDYLLRDRSVRFNAFMDKYIFKRPFVNNVYAKGPNIYDFSDDDAYHLGDAGYTEIDKSVSRLKDIQDYLEENGVKFLVIPVPKISSVYNYPDYVLNPEKVDIMYAKYLKDKLDKAGISNVYLRDELKYEDFYKTDHHITKTGGDKIINAIDEYLKTFGDGLLPAKIDTKLSHFKGSRSRRMAYWTGTDELQIPIYNTPYKRQSAGGDMINNFDQNMTYGGYMCGDMSYDSIVTDNDGADIVIYGDSFTNIVESFIWPRVKRMRSYDLRNESSKDLERAIDTDVVILIADEHSFRLGKEYIFYK